MHHHLFRGVLAGAAGTTALNTATYLDMAVRARPGSTSPERTVQEAEHRLGALPGGESAVRNRRSGLGALLGIGAGLGVGAAYGCARTGLPRAPLPLMAIAAGLAANVAGTAPMTALGVTDPRGWTAQSWAMDLVPHLAYGVVTALTFEAFR